VIRMPVYAFVARSTALLAVHVRVPCSASRVPLVIRWHLVRHRDMRSDHDFGYDQKAHRLPVHLPRPGFKYLLRVALPRARPRRHVLAGAELSDLCLAAAAPIARLAVV